MLRSHQSWLNSFKLLHSKDKSTSLAYIMYVMWRGLGVEGCRGQRHSSRALKEGWTGSTVEKGLWALDTALETEELVVL